MTETTHAESSEKKGLNFVEEIVVEDLKAGKNDGRLQTRFPPEPNGYLHIGHAKSDLYGLRHRGKNTAACVI